MEMRRFPRRLSAKQGGDSVQLEAPGDQDDGLSLGDTPSDERTVRQSLRDNPSAEFVIKSDFRRKERSDKKLMDQTIPESEVFSSLQYGEAKEMFQEVALEERVESDIESDDSFVEDLLISNEEHQQFRSEVTSLMPSSDILANQINRFTKKKVQQRAESSDDDEEMGKVDFCKVLEQHQQENSTNFPFTQNHIEDCLFIRDPKNPKGHQILALECVFYQTNCHYYMLAKNPLTRVNRMGTENYWPNDEEDFLEWKTFDQEPTNLKVLRQQYFTKQREGVLQSTTQTEAKVEFFLSLWKVNPEGGLCKMRQSESFKLGRKFYEHYGRRLRLELTDDQEKVYLLQDFISDEPWAIRLWDVQSLEEDKAISKLNSILNNDIKYMKQKHAKELKYFLEKQIMTQLTNRLTFSEEEKKNNAQNKLMKALKNQGKLHLQEEIDHMRLVGGLDFLMVVYKKGDGTTMQRMDFYNTTTGRKIFTFSGFFDTSHEPSTMAWGSSSMGHSQMSPIGNRRSNSSYSIHSISEEDQSFSDDRPPRRPMARKDFTDKEGDTITVFCPTMLIGSQDWYDPTGIFSRDVRVNLMFICSRMSRFININGEEEYGYPVTFVASTLQDLAKERANWINYTTQKAYDRFNYFFTVKGTDTEESKKLYGEYFIMDKEWLDEETADGTLLFEHLDIQASANMKQFGFNYMMKSSQEIQVFCSDSSRAKKSFTFSTNIRVDKGDEAQLSFVRNQHLKNQVLCIFKSVAEGKRCYSFSPNDIVAPKKHFELSHDHPYSEVDVQQVVLKDQILLQVCSIKEFNQRITFQVFAEDPGQYKMEERLFRLSDNQEFISEYPCLASNLGHSLICVHININPNKPKALVFDLNNLGEDEAVREMPISSRREQKEQSEDKETFFGFVNFDSLESIGLDTDNINIWTSSRILFLTKSSLSQMDTPDRKGKLRVRLNLLLVDPYGPSLQAAHFQSKKIFEFDRDTEFQDTKLVNQLFKNGDDLHLVTQFPTGIHHCILKPDMQPKKEPEKKIRKETTLQQSNNNSMSVNRLELSKMKDLTAKSTDAAVGLFNFGKKVVNQIAGAPLQKKEAELGLMLRKQMASIRLFSDSYSGDEVILYFAIVEDQDVFIKRFCPSAGRDDQLSTILHLQNTRLLGFKQLSENEFIVIDHLAEIHVYSLDQNQLIKQGRLYCSEKDQAYILENFTDYKSFGITKEVLVFGHSIIYLSTCESNLDSRIFQREDLIQQIQSDVDFLFIRGPIAVRGQSQFINLYVFKDRKLNFFFYEQFVYHLPTSGTRNLIHDFGKKCLMSTFLKNGNIFAQIGSRFLKFSEDGYPLDEIEFEGTKNDFKGEHRVRGLGISYFLVYWFEYLCLEDSGVNRLLFMVDEEDPKKVEKSKSYSAQFSRAKAKYEELVKSKVAIMVEVNKNKGFFFHCYQPEQAGFAQDKCLNQAREDYYRRLSLVEMSQDNQYFLFFDRLLDKFGLWFLKDKTEENLKSFKSKPIRNPAKYIRSFLTQAKLSPDTCRIETNDLTDDNWEIHSPKELLSSSPSKFQYRRPKNEGLEEPRFIELTLEEACSLEAIGFKSANDFANLDPKIVRVSWYTEDGALDTEQDIKLKFSARYQTLSFLKTGMTADVEAAPIKRVRIDIIETNEPSNLADYQLSQILLFKKRSNYDFKFKEVNTIQLNFDEAINAGMHKIANRPGSIKRMSTGLQKKSSFFDCQYLNSYTDRIQRRILDRHSIAYDQDPSRAFTNFINQPENKTLKEEHMAHKKRVFWAFLNQSNVIKHLNSKEDGSIEVIFSYCDQVNLKDENQKQSKRARDPIDLKVLVFKDNGKTDLFTEVLYFDLKNKREAVERIRHEINTHRKQVEREFIAEIGLEAYQRNSTKFHVFKEQQRKLYFKLSNIAKVSVGQNHVLVKQANQVGCMLTHKLMSIPQELKWWQFKKEEKNLDDFRLLSLNFSKDTEIVDMKTTENPNIYQILAVDKGANVFAIATWDIIADVEVQMLQLKTQIDDPSPFFMLGISNPACGDCSAKKASYFLEDGLLWNLTNNTPFLFMDPTPKATSPQETLSRQTNMRKVYFNSSRFLNPQNHCEVLFPAKERDIKLWVDLEKCESPTQILDSISDVLKEFKVKFSGLSLFHHFAGDTEMIEYFEQKYMEQSPDDSQLRMVPLLLMSGADNSKSGSALELSVQQQRPNNFERMVHLVTDFPEVCTTRLMLPNLGLMVKTGFHQVLEHFSKTLYKPPILQQPMIISWPDDVDTLAFSGTTSLVSQNMIRKALGQTIVSSDTGTAKHLGIINEIFENGRSERRVGVQALDFDWIFEDENTKMFLELLQDTANEQIFAQRSIMIFVDFLWKLYWWEIVLKDFAPFLLYLLLFILMTASEKLNFVDHLITDPDGGSSTLIGVIGNLNLYKQFQGLLIIICLVYMGYFAYREIAQAWRQGLVIYYIEIWNWIDLLMPVLNIFYLIKSGFLLFIEDEISLGDKEFMKTISALCMLVLCMKVFYYMKLFDKPAYFLAQLRYTVIAVGGFLVMFGIVILTFTISFFLLQQNLPENGYEEISDGQTTFHNYINPKLNNRFIDALISVYLISLGQFETDGFSFGVNSTLIWILFLVSTVTLQIIFMNMVIAVMAEPFGEVKENSEVYKNEQRVEMILDHIDHIDIKDKFKGHRYIFVVAPQEVN